MTTDLTGKTIFITGANTGIGRASANELARRGARVWLACRSREKTEPVLAEIRAATGREDAAAFVACDLGSLASVRTAAETFLASGEKLHVLLNNAGVAGQRGLTKDGFELHFGTNHVGHFLLTKLLLPRLRECAPARIVNVASKSHYRAKGIDWDAIKKPTASITGLPEYEVSKLANVLFTKELAHGRAGEGVRSYALHPGVVASDAWRRMPWPIRPMAKAFMISNADGCRSSVHCATSPDVADHDGRYYDSDTRERRPSRVADDEALARELWERSEGWVAA
jgi:NAD(P)-dependent dehydrogenase (short-subunit alcohol dehydrogenase family)